ncbi:MAG: hypothetical protein KDC34_03920 [Saprospiraceae bacterium]|nr:hypothetical protein [Saprospiraceae bacterium]
MIKEFSRELLRDPECGILFDYQSDHDTLFICFAGGGPDMATSPPFEFSGVLRNLDVKKMFVRDISNCVYHNGLKHLSGNFEETTGILAAEVKRSGCKRVVTIGNCQGAYAAIYYGAMLQADLVLAFAPLTFVDEENRTRYGEKRWPDGFERLYNCGTAAPHLYDLTTLPETQDLPIDIYYDPHYVPDTNLVQHFIPGKTNIRVYERPGGEHLLVRNLKKSGELDEILEKACSSERALNIR